MGTPKALLELRGETFADRLIGLFTEFCEEVIVVLGHDADRIRAGIRHDARFILNPDHHLGQLTSLQAGLRAIAAETAAVFFTPVDHPAIERSTVEALLQTFTPEMSAVVPRYQGRHGHPVLVSSRITPDFLNLQPSCSARDIMHAIVGSTSYVDVEDPGILKDIDDPEAYEALRQVGA
jgi:molybdenum cofactor cytidylyltransferase